MPLCSPCDEKKWIPACAGMTESVPVSIHVASFSPWSPCLGGERAGFPIGSGMTWTQESPRGLRTHPTKSMQIREIRVESVIRGHPWNPCLKWRGGCSILVRFSHQTRHGLESNPAGSANLFIPFCARGYVHQVQRVQHFFRTKRAFSSPSGGTRFFAPFRRMTG